MAKFMLILHNTPGVWRDLSPEEMQRKVQKYQAWVDKIRSSGRHLSSEKLGEEGGKLLSLHNGRVNVVDGPYSEAKEVVGGYFLFRAANYEEAIELTRDCPFLDDGRIELRQNRSLGLRGRVMAEAPRVHELVEHLFRHQAGRMLASLTHIFGLENLDLAEEVVQEALLQALQQWRFHGVPENPQGWLLTAARNKALDVLRRRANFRRKERELERRLSDRQSREDMADSSGVDGLADEQLAMIFACCSPALTSEARVALTLKAVSGFSVAEIARAFLAEEAAIAQRLVRAKRRIREAQITLAMPAAPDIPARLDSVLQVLYLLFNEGYAAHKGENLVREDLCGEAIRLAQLLASRRDAGLPKVHALLALFYFQAARLEARVDGEGNLLLLAEQERSQWDQELLALGVEQLEQAAQGSELSEYHLQAAIAVVHATSSSVAETDWPRLVALYDELFVLAPSPVVALNRAVAQSMVEGPEAALASLDELSTEPALKSYYLLPAVRADLLRRLGRMTEAAACYREALAYPCSEPERRFLQRRMESLNADTRPLLADDASF